MRKPTVLVADSHVTGRAGLCRILDRDFEVVGAVGNGHALASTARALRPDIIVTDIAMPDVGGIEAVRSIRTADAGVKIVFLGAHADMVRVIDALTAGGSAYVLKSTAPTELVTAIHDTLRGRVYVTPSIVKGAAPEPETSGASPNEETPRLSARQREILRAIAIGHTMKEIAAALQISIRTVEFHKYHLMRQVGVKSVAELTRLAMKLRMLAP